MGKKFDATETGVSEEQEQETPSLMTDRAAMMESIIETNDESEKKYAEDMGVDDPGDGDDLPTDDDDGNNDDDKTDDLPPDDDDGNNDDDKTDDLPPEEQPEMVKIVVDGEEKEVLLSDVMDAGKRTYQKESAADKRLEEATRLLKEAKEQKPPVDDEDPSQGEDDAAPMSPKEIAEALQYGTAEEAAQAIEQLNSQGRSREEVVTPERVQEIAKKAVQETNNAEEIASKFHKAKDDGGFKDLTDDPYLRNMVIERVNKRLEAKEPNTWETYEKAGTEVREWLDGHVSGKPKDSFAGKKEKKKTIDNIQAAGAAKGNLKPKNKGQTATDVINEIAASRPGR